MSRAPSTFRQRDLTAALRAAQAAGLQVVRIEVGTDGHIVMVTSETAPPGDLLDQELADWEARRGR